MHAAALSRVSCPRLLLCLCLAVALAVPCAEAQVIYGSLVGNVSDPSQAAVPAASVTILNTGTGQSRTMATNESGYFSFTNVDPGTYRLLVTTEGFRQAELDGVIVTSNAVTRADVGLQLGSVSESVMVSAQNLTLQTDRSDVRHEVTTKALVNLPLPPGRNYQQLFTTLPGFAPPENAHSVPANPSRGLRLHVNGTSSSAVNTRIDGASTTNIFIPHITGYVPALESIETVNVATNSFDAEQGLAGGAAVNVQIKSGTNELRGSAFWYHNNNQMKAKPFFMPQDERNPKLVYNQFGATLGGPIRRNSAFYFVSYEGTTDHKLGTGFASIPTPLMRTGNLSASPTAIYDPYSGTASGAGRVPFAGNIIPNSMIDQRVAKILPMWPSPNINIATAQRNYYVAQPFGFDRHTLDLKLNWNPTAKLSTYGRMSLLDFSTSNVQWFGPELGGPPIGGGQAGNATGRVYNTTMAATYVASPTFVVDSYFGYSYMAVDSRQSRLDENIGKDFLGIPGTNGTRFFEGGWPQFAIASFTTIGIPNAFQPMFQDDPQFQWVANANKVIRNHDIRFGFDAYYQELNQAQPEMSGAPYGASGGFGFAQGQTRLLGGPVGSEYNAFGSFLLGVTNRLGRTNLVPDALYTRSWMFAGYVRDRWQVNRKLTLSYGLRWEYFPLLGRIDRGVEMFDWANNRMLICGVGPNPRDCNAGESARLFRPRLGLAYRASDTLVIRAGYGITNDPFTLVRPLRGNYPVILASDIISSNGFAPASLLREGIPEIAAPDISSGIVPIDGRIASISLMPDNWKRGYIQSWNFTLQKQFPGRWVGEAGYVATRSVRQIGNFDRNAGSPGGGNASRPFFAPYGRIARTAQIVGIGTNMYDSLQTRLERRFDAGYQIGINYTFSKALGYSGNENSDGVPQINLPEYFHLNRAISGIDRTHSFHATGIAELPFGRGKPFASNGFAAAILGGWQLNGILSMFSGPPFSVTAPAADLNAPGNTQRADQVKPVVEKLGGAGGRQKFYDPTAFAQVRAPRFGTAGFNSLRGPGGINLDAGLFRRFSVNEKITVQFRAEAFNFTNTPKFGNPNGDVGSSQFMEITTTRGTGREGIDERVFRVGIRLGW